VAQIYIFFKFQAKDLSQNMKKKINGWIETCISNAFSQEYLDTYTPTQTQNF